VVGRAAELEVEARELATTFLGVVVADHESLLIQIGDGAIVFRCANTDDFAAAFWPQTIEYANTTYFLTDPKFEAHANFRHECSQVIDIALFTDGLERLALRFSDQTVHDPFLVPMFARLSATSCVEELFEPLRGFLSSDAVNERTDDDRTLILATRGGDAGLSDGTD